MPEKTPLLARIGRVIAIVGGLVMLGTAVAMLTRGPGGADGGWGYLAGWMIGTGIVVLGGLFVLVGRSAR